MVSAASLHGLLAVNLNSPGYYIHWGLSSYRWRT